MSSSLWELGCFSVVRPLLVAAEREAERSSGDTVRAEPPGLAELERWLSERDVRAADGGPLRLGSNPPRRRKPKSLAETYDARVCAGEIPTRPGCWHDVFNVAAFASFPRTKVELHRRQLRALVEREERGIPRTGARCRERDTLTLLDEGGVLLAVAAADFAACRAAIERNDLPMLDGWHREGRVRPWVLGHALLEHAVRTALGDDMGPAPRGMTLPVEVPVEGLGALDVVDRAFASELASRRLVEPPGYPAIALRHWFPDTPDRAASVGPDALPSNGGGPHR